jgi:hypothetical protein
VTIRIILSYRTRHRVTGISVSDSVIRHRAHERDDERISLRESVEPL